LPLPASKPLHTQHWRLAAQRLEMLDGRAQAGNRRSHDSNSASATAAAKSVDTTTASGKR
jgi:hypothetical protein